MAAKRLSMRKLKEVLRLRALGHSDRSIARSLNIGRSTVRRYRRRAEEMGLGWPEAASLAESELEARLFPPSDPTDGPRRSQEGGASETLSATDASWRPRRRCS